MSKPLVSVVIPAHNHASYIAGSVESVLRQSCARWELVVVDDGSTDGTAEVVEQFDDPRIRCVRQPNRGLPAARNTGIANSSGAYLAFLDADDLYHPRKLEAQLADLARRPEAELSFSSRFEVDQELNPLWLIRAPSEITIEDLLLGFPFTINDLLVRREAVEEVGGFDESYVLHGEDRDFYLRLWLQGCHFAGLSDFLAYRRLHTQRVFRDIPGRRDIMLRALDDFLAAPRCPAEATGVGDAARANVCLSWAYQQYAQGEMVPAQRDLLQAVRLHPALLEDGAHALLGAVTWASIRDGGDHEAALRGLFAHLPSELSWLSGRSDAVVARGYLMRGGRDAVWGRVDEAQDNLGRAMKLGAVADQEYLGSMADLLLNYEDVFGAAKLRVALRDFSAAIVKVGAWRDPRRLYALYSIARAFRDYHAGRYSAVPGNVLRGAVNDPSHLLNRGVTSVLIRSSLKTWGGAGARASAGGHRI